MIGYEEKPVGKQGREVEVLFDPNITRPVLVLYMPAATEGTVQTDGMWSIVAFYNQCVNLVYTKNITYRDAWRRQGYMGNTARIMSKVERLKAMLWQDHQLEDANEPVSDTLLDLANVTAFAAINQSEGNKWGVRHP